MIDLSGRIYPFLPGFILPEIQKYRKETVLRIEQDIMKENAEAGAEDLCPSCNKKTKNRWILDKTYYVCFSCGKVWAERNELRKKT